MWYIVSILIILIVIFTLSDTNVQLYKHYGDKKGVEHKLQLPVWSILAIIALGIVPGLNIILFASFIILYNVLAYQNPKHCYECSVVSLRGRNWLTKSLLKIKKFLTKTI